MAGALLAATTAPAPAAMITWEWGGTVTSVDDPHGVLDGLVAVGDPFTGTYTFDSQTPDARPDNPQVGVYVSDQASMDVVMGNLTFGTSGDGCIIVVGNDPSGGFSDNLSMGLAGPIAKPDFDIVESDMKLLDITASSFSSDSLPLSPPSLTLFDNAGFGFEGEHENVNFSAWGPLDYLVPEPATLVLFLGAVFCLSSRRRTSPSAAHS